MGVAHVSYSGNMSTKDWGADNINQQAIVDMLIHDWNILAFDNAD